MDLQSAASHCADVGLDDLRVHYLPPSALATAAPGICSSALYGGLAMEDGLTLDPAAYLQALWTDVLDMARRAGGGGLGHFALHSF